MLDFDLVFLMHFVDLERLLFADLDRIDLEPLREMHFLLLDRVLRLEDLFKDFVLDLTDLDRLREMHFLLLDRVLRLEDLFDDLDLLLADFDRLRKMHFFTLDLLVLRETCLFTDDDLIGLHFLASLTDLA